MVARVFSDRGGLELYTYKLVQGLLDLGHRVTVICNKDETKEIKGSTSENLKVIAYGDGKKRKKADAMRWDLLYAAKTVKEAGDFDIVHSQHFPFVYQKDNLVVTYHNHTQAGCHRLDIRWKNCSTSSKCSTAQPIDCETSMIGR